MNALPRWTLALLTSLIVLLPAARLAAQAPAQEEGPLAVVAFGSVDAILAHTVKILNAADGAAEVAQLQAMVKMIEAGLDTKRPWGVVVSPGDPQPQPLAFLPVTNFDDVLNSPVLKGFLGEPKDLGDGTFQIDGPQTIFVKQHNGWAFVALAAESLAALPDDPLPLLDGLEKEYDVAARVYVQRIPPATRGMVLEKLGGFGLGAAPPELGDDAAAGEFGGLGAAEDEPKPAPADPFGAADPGAADDPFGAPGGVPAGPDGAGGFEQQVASVLDQLDVVTIGLSLDGDAVKATLDVTASVIETSLAAPRFAALTGVTSNHAGLLSGNPAMAVVHAAVPLLPEDAELLAKWFESQLPSDDEFAAQEFADVAERANAQKMHELSKLGLRLLAVTARTGKLDGGMAMVAKPKDSTFVFGGRAGDAAALREVMIGLVREMQRQAGIPQDRFSRVDYKGYRFVIVEGIKHADLPKADGAAEAAGAADDMLFADEIEVALAIKDADYYLAMGNQCVDRVKAIIDASEAGAAAPAAPVSIAYGARSLMLFANQSGEETAGFDKETLARLAGVEGPDQVLVSVRPAPGGATLRVEIEKLPLLMAIMGAQNMMKQGPEPAPGDDPFGL